MKYPHLFEPIMLGNKQFRNRIFGAPIGLEYYPNEKMHPGDEFIAFYERKARGGAATVSIGSVMADQLNFSGNVIHSMAVYGELDKWNIKVSTSTRVVSIDKRGVCGEFVGHRYSVPKPCETLKKGMLESAVMKAASSIQGEEGTARIFEADTVIYALGQASLREEVNKLRDCAPIFYELGDCVDPKNVYEANSTAYTIDRDIGMY